MPYRTAEQLDNITFAFATVFPSLFTRIKLPNPSILGAPIYAVRMRGGAGTGRRGVLITGGLHARELMNPDAIVDLMVDLCVAYQNGMGITYGGRTWSDFDIRLMVETLDIWMIPCANPDGRQRVIDGDCLWRKNVRDNPRTSCEGVDVNRNFNIAWGTVTNTTSCTPCDYNQTYCGSAAFSEPESKNIKAFCDAHAIDVFVDVHSFSELVLYPWGHAATQVTNPSQNFTTLATGTCLPLNPPTYQEYMRKPDRLRFQTVAQRIVDSVGAVRGRSYTPEPIHALYGNGASGDATDYIYSRHLANPARHKTYAFALETGPDTGDAERSFHPSDETQLSLIKRDTKAAILTLIEQSICAIDLIGTWSDRAPIVETIRLARDETLSTTEPGQGWIDLFERVQGPLLGQILGDEALQKEAVDLFERAAVLAEKDSAKLSGRDAARARAFLDRAAKRLPADVRRDVDQIQERLTSAEGRTAPQIIATLMREAPRPPARRKASTARPRKREKRGA